MLNSIMGDFPISSTRIPPAFFDSSGRHLCKRCFWLLALCY